MGSGRVLGSALAILIAASCAKAQESGSVDAADPGPTPDASCGALCDDDKDGVVDTNDQCPKTPSGAVVNHLGCSDAQATWKLEPFPAFGLTWVPTGNLGMAGGLTWTYTGIERGDLFHIAWLVCDDPATPCGLSLDGAVDVPAENWTFSAAASDLTGGKLVFTNTTHILLADTTTPSLNGRLTMTIVDGSDAALRFADVPTMGMTARLSTHGAEITGTAFKVVALAEVQDSTLVWTPYIDYYNAAPTPMAGGDTHTSFGGSFYSK
jgi:hypothetical protein